jgi:hypothetical protein
MTEKLERIQRCCPEHADWQVLTEHLCRDFPSVSRDQVLRNVLDVQAVTERFDLDMREALDVGGLIVRYRLMLSTGEIADVARTDPQTHHMASSEDAEDTESSEDSAFAQ